MHLTKLKIHHSKPDTYIDLKNKNAHTHACGKGRQNMAKLDNKIPGPTLIKLYERAKKWKVIVYVM